MTVCIAALCEGGKSCVVAADRMVVQLQGPVLDLETKLDNHQAKICKLSPCSVLLHSGEKKDVEAIVAAAREFLAKDCTSVREAVARGAEDVLKRKRDSQVAQVMGPTFDFDSLVAAIAKLSTGPLCEVWQQALKVDVGEAILLSPEGGEFEVWNFKPPRPDKQRDTPYAALGTGSTLAHTALAIQGYTKDLPQSEALFQVYLAKRAAELRSYGVGEATDMALLTKEGSTDMKPETLVLMETYRKKRMRLDNQEWVALQQAIS